MTGLVRGGHPKPCGVPEVGLSLWPATIAVPAMGMIVAVSLRLVYLIFDRLLEWLTLLGRSSS
jgi:hypothetical protein